MLEIPSQNSTYANAAYELLVGSSGVGLKMAKLLERWRRSVMLPPSPAGSAGLMQAYMSRMEPDEGDPITIQFERGLDLVLRTLKQVKEGCECPWGRPVLLILGGGKTGVRGAGQVVALREAGLAQAFDVVGISVGAFIGAYFLCNLKSAAWGTTLFSQEANGKEFHDRGGTRMNLDYLIGMMREGRKKIGYETIQRGPAGFFVIVTKADGTMALVDMKRQSGDDFFAYMKASASLPLVHGKTIVKGEEFWDGGIINPLPIQDVLRIFGRGNRPVLVLANGPYQPPHTIGANTAEQAAAMAFRLAGKGIHASAATRMDPYSASLQWIRNHPSYPVGVMFSPPDGLSIVSRDANHLRSSAYASRIDALIRLHRAGLFG